MRESCVWTIELGIVLMEYVSVNLAWLSYPELAISAEPGKPEREARPGLETR